MNLAANWRRTITGALLTVFAVGFSLANADDSNDSRIYLASGDERVDLIELYTSEGCSSCPPADKWLSQFVDSNELWKDVVPVAFHVDYWDYIGWKDRFARPGFTTRQPGVFLSGAEWQRWRRESIDYSASDSSGKLDAVVDTRTGAFAARYVASESDLKSNDSFVLHTAILGFDVVTEVERGENGGRELNHDFVVLGYRETRLTAAIDPTAIPESLQQATASTDQTEPDTNTYVSEAELPSVTEVAPRQAIAFWISRANSTEPLQATGGWISTVN